MSDWIETYGYPHLDFLGKNENGHWVRIVDGWFFPEDDENDTACYLELHINEKGQVIVMLDWIGIIKFDFETPLDDYLLPCSKTITIGDLYHEQKTDQ